MSLGFELITQGKAEGIINVIGLFLAWIGGTLVWGLAVLMHQRPSYDLPPLFTTMNENIGRLAAMKVHAGGLSAVTSGLDVHGTDGE
jgi:hypothetical protein